MLPGSGLKVCGGGDGGGGVGYDGDGGGLCVN
jgi:hypothetical protein